MLEEILKLDREIFIYLNNMGIDEYDGFWLIITKFPTWIPLFLAIVILLFWKNTVQQALWMILSYISMLSMLYLTISLVKYNVGRLRPNNDEAINTLIRIVHQPNDFSFFSGHAATSFCIATMAVLLLRKKFKWVHLIWIYPLLFSFSRIYLGVHYPTDIVVGALVGVLFAYVFYGMYTKFKAPYL